MGKALFVFCFAYGIIESILWLYPHAAGISKYLLATLDTVIICDSKAKIIISKYTCGYTNLDLILHTY